MGAKIKITEINPELEQQLQEKYGFDVETIKEYVGKEVTLKSDELYELLKDAEAKGIIQLEEIENGHKDEQQKDSNTQEGTKNNSQIRQGEDSEVKQDDDSELAQNDDSQIGQQDDVEEGKEQNTENVRRSLQIVAIQRLERLEIYINLSSKEQAKLRSAYEDIRADEANDIRDEDFLEKRINNSDPRERMSGVRQVHLMVLNGTENEMNVFDEQGGVETPDMNDGGQDITSKVRIIENMDLQVKEGAELEMAQQLKKYIEMATTNKPAAQTLMVIGDLKSYMEEIKQDSLGSIDAGSETEAAQLYLAQMPISEMGAVMAAMKDATEGVQVRFDDIDWNNEIERKVAINLLAQTQQVAQEFGGTEQVVDKVVIQFEVNDWQDIQEMTNTCKELKTAGIIQTTDVAAQVKVPDSLGEEQKEQLEKAAGEVLATNGIEPEQKDVVSSEEITEELINGTDADIDKLSAQADEMPAEIAKAIDVATHAIANEIIGPGIGRPTNS